jgi:hypothetical protein
LLDGHSLPGFPVRFLSHARAPGIGVALIAGVLMIAPVRNHPARGFVMRARGLPPFAQSG